jgi:hypothetical protein
MSVFANSIILKVESLVDPTMPPYISSSIQPLKNVEYMQRGAYTYHIKNPSDKRNLSYFPLYEKGAVKITELEKFPCNSRKELNTREKFYVQSMDCCNKKMNGRTAREKYMLNQKKNQEKGLQFYHANKEIILKQKKQYYINNKSYFKNYYRTHRKKIKAYYEKNKDKYKLYAQRFKAKVAKEKEELLFNI